LDAVLDSQRAALMLLAVRQLVVDITSPGALLSPNGRYKISERRPDGSLVLVPESAQEVLAAVPTARSAARSFSPPSIGSTLLPLSANADEFHFELSSGFTKHARTRAANPSEQASQERRIAP
jgi:hypothetical protein